MLKHAAIAVALSLPLPNLAKAQSFDFESVIGGFYSSILLSNGGLSLTVTPEFPNGFAFVGNSNVGLIGQAVIGTQTNPLTVGFFAPLRFTFSQLVSAIAFNFGDGGGDDDNPVTIQWFSAANVLLGTHTDTYDANFGAGKTAALSTPGAAYFIVDSSPIFNPHSLWWEVASVTPEVGVVPEPGPLTLVGTGIAGVAALRRRRRAA
jgi:hypothetical protein